MCFCQVVMAERWLGCSWKRHVSEQLKLRDRVQRQAFEEIVHQCESCFLDAVPSRRGSLCTCCSH